MDLINEPVLWMRHSPDQQWNHFWNSDYSRCRVGSQIGHVDLAEKYVLRQVDSEFQDKKNI